MSREAASDRGISPDVLTSEYAGDIGEKRTEQLGVTPAGTMLRSEGRYLEEPAVRR